MKMLFRFRKGTTFKEKILETPKCPTCQENKWIKLGEHKIKCTICEEILKINPDLLKTP